MNFCALYIVVILACLAPAFSQRVVVRRQAQSCVTPENYYGSCVTLSHCPQVANIYRTAPQYVIALQRSCGTRSVNRDPVVCCTRPATAARPTAARPTAARPTTARQPAARPTTTAANPFLPSTRVPHVTQPSTSRNTRNPQTGNPFLTTVPTTTTGRVTTMPVATSAPLVDNRAGTCHGPDTRLGVCIRLESCPELVNQLYDNQGNTVFANYLRASNRICGGSGSTVCCPSNAAATSPSTSRPIANSNEIPRRLPTVAEGCGYTTNSYKKIVGGEVSKRGAWPWIALIGYSDDLSPSPFKCGGALVTARHVVTAAHCIRNDLSFVRLGEHDLSTDTEARHVDVRVVRKEAHPQYNRRNGRSDIAVLYLESNVQFSDFISPICLPITPALRQKSYVNHTPFVVGWGKTMEGGASASVLQELQIPIYNNAVCRDAYQRQNRLFSADQFDSAVICAGVLSGGKDTCQGDSGGPLMIPEPYQNNVRYYLIGVVSYGIGCARPQVPGVYSSTQHFIDWIAQKVADTR